MIPCFFYSQVGIVIKDSDISFHKVKTGDDKTPEGMLKSLFFNVATFDLGDEVIYLGKSVDTLKRVFIPALRKVVNGELESIDIDFGEYGTFENQSFRGACQLDDQRILVAGDKGLFKLKGNSSG